MNKMEKIYEAIFYATLQDFLTILVISYTIFKYCYYNINFRFMGSLTALLVLATLTSGVWIKLHSKSLDIEAIFYKFTF